VSIKRYNSMGEKAFKKVQSCADFNNIRFKDLPVVDCSKAGWNDYNLGFTVLKL
jgi:hypothetical protein